MFSSKVPYSQKPSTCALQLPGSPELRSTSEQPAYRSLDGLGREGLSQPHLAPALEAGCRNQQRAHPLTQHLYREGSLGVAILPPSLPPRRCLQQKGVSRN